MSPTVTALSGIFTDVDDTLTHKGHLVPEACRAISDAKARGLRVVAVTGRPAGWGEVLASLLPFDAVIAENGALAILPSGERIYWTDDATRLEHAARLVAVVDDVLAHAPRARLSADHRLRELDVAFDIGEHQHLSTDEIAQTRARIESHGARCLVSTVHAHAFYADYDKAKMAARLAAELWNEDAQQITRDYVFVGDSPNDQAAFAFFPRSYGVANVRRYLPVLAPPPAKISTAEGGYGFAEIVAELLKSLEPNSR